MKNGSRAECHLINVKPRGRGNHRLQGWHSPRTDVYGGADEGFKWAKTQGVTHLCRRNDGDPSQQGGYKEAVSAWEVLNTPIHHANTILQTPPSSGAISTAGFSFTQQQIHLGRKRRAGVKEDTRSVVPSES